MKLEALRTEGWRRAVLYEFAAYTGLRVNECATLTWGDVVLDGKEPCITVKAKNAKSRRRGQSVPLVPWVVTALKDLWQRNKAARVRENKPMLQQSDLVCDVNRGLLDALRKDAKWAFGDKLGDYDAQGRRTTFHGFRASTCTMLHRAGVALAVAVRIMRHADSKLTIETYAKLDALADGHRELSKMAVPRVTAVSLGVELGVNARPRLAVGGCDGPIVASDASAQLTSSPTDRPTLAESGHSWPEAQMVGVAGVEPATLSLSTEPGAKFYLCENDAETAISRPFSKSLSHRARPSKSEHNLFVSVLPAGSLM